MLSQANPSQTKDDIAALRREAGAYVRSKRESAGLSQRDLANRVNLEHYTFISQIEAGRGRVPPDRYEAYAVALDVDTREFAMTMLKFHEPHTYRLLFPEAARADEAAGKAREEAKAEEKSLIAQLQERLARLESKFGD